MHTVHIHVDHEDRVTVVPGDWREDTAGAVGVRPLAKQGSNNYSFSAKEVRDNYKDYFNSDTGSVPWQSDIIKRRLLPCDL